MSTEIVKPEIRTLSVKDAGFSLPIGVFDGKTLHKGFSLMELGFNRERALGQFKVRIEGQPNTVIVTKLLALVLKNLAGKPFEHPTEIEQAQEEIDLLRISAMYQADIFYMYLKARIEELGPEYAIQFFCSNCKFEGKLTMDLNALDVNYVDDPALLTQKIPLLRGFKARGTGELKKLVSIAPMLWINMTTPEAAEAGSDQTLMKLHFISKCTTYDGPNGEPMLLTDDELGSLRKIDTETIAKQIDKTNIGVNMTLKGKCPGTNCNYPFAIPVDWDYDHFFSIASLP